MSRLGKPTQIGIFWATILVCQWSLSCPIFKSEKSELQPIYSFRGDAKESQEAEAFAEEVFVNARGQFFKGKPTRLEMRDEMAGVDPLNIQRFVERNSRGQIVSHHLIVNGQRGPLPIETIFPISNLRNGFAVYEFKRMTSRPDNEGAIERQLSALAHYIASQSPLNQIPQNVKILAYARKAGARRRLVQHGFEDIELPPREQRHGYWPLQMSSVALANYLP